MTELAYGGGVMTPLVGPSCPVPGGTARDPVPDLLGPVRALSALGERAFEEGEVRVVAVPSRS